MDIETLIRRIKQGERQAFAGVVTHFQRPLFGFLGRMGFSQAQAEEIAQETFVRAWTQLGSYERGKGQFSTWLFTIARNLALNESACASSRHEVALADDVAELSCTGPSPEDELGAARDRERLRQALLQLPAADRSALALAYISGFDLASVAKIEGCSTAAIKTRLHRAKEKLRQLLGATDE